jgi:hypothetical protein
LVDTPSKVHVNSWDTVSYRVVYAICTHPTPYVNVADITTRGHSHILFRPVFHGLFSLSDRPLRIGTTANPKKKNKRAKFATKNACCWIYITGLPADTNEDEVAQVLNKAGILDLDPETQRPKIKLYRNKDKKTSPNLLGECKGDASLCYRMSPRRTQNGTNARTNSVVKLMSHCNTLRHYYGTSYLKTIKHPTQTRRRTGYSNTVSQENGVRNGCARFEREFVGSA